MIKTWSTRGRYGRKIHYTTILLKIMIVGFLIIISSVIASTVSSSIKTTTSSSSLKRTTSSIPPQQSCTGSAVVPSNRRACGLFLWDLVGKRMDKIPFGHVCIVCCSKQTNKQLKNKQFSHYSPFSITEQK